MSLKFQFQFAGVDLRRPSSPHRKWLRIGLTVLAVAVAGLAYWQYLHHLLHQPRPVTHAVAAASAPVAADSDKPASTAPTLKQVANVGIMALGNYLLNAVKIAPATATMTAPDPVETVVVAPVVSPIIMGAPKPTLQRPLRIRTDQERLCMAGQTAFGNMMDAANKYPDAYGFHAEDFLSDAKLGAPMPVYTIEQSVRANYQRGQPVKPLLKPAKLWVFPVTMGDRFCCMVEVTQDGRNYVPGPGNKSLAMAWNKITQKWPAQAGYHPLLLVNPDVPGFYFTVPELPVQNITDTIQMSYRNPSTSPADVILASWR